MFSFYEQVDNVSETLAKYESADNKDDIIKAMEDEMNQAARELAFEKAAELRDRTSAYLLNFNYDNKFERQIIRHAQ